MTYYAIFLIYCVAQYENLMANSRTVCQPEGIPHLSFTMMSSCSMFLLILKFFLYYSKFKDPYHILILYFQ